MPRTVQDIIDHADQLAQRFENYEPTADDERDPTITTDLRNAVIARSDAERAITNAITNARTNGYTWAHIGNLIGTSGEAARQKYGHVQQI